jgi:imidazole glycerol-phosphate synthase subunit HisF
VKKKRVIPVLLLRDNWLVQSKNFEEFKKIGNPTAGVRRFSDWDADELIYLNITQGDSFTNSREDTKHPGFSSAIDALSEVCKAASMPITIGGGIKTLSDIEMRLALGADKIAINSQALVDPQFIAEASKEFGSQCIVLSIDFKIENKVPRVWNRNLNSELLPNLDEWVMRAEALGAGEFLINSVSRDGKKNGYDVETMSRIADLTSNPVIACGGAGSWGDMYELLVNSNVDAVAAANIFHFQDQSIFLARRELLEKGLSVRPPTLSS